MRKLLINVSTSEFVALRRAVDNELSHQHAVAHDVGRGNPAYIRLLSRLLDRQLSEDLVDPEAGAPCPKCTQPLDDYGDWVVTCGGCGYGLGS